jgi:hypothetical protein
MRVPQREPGLLGSPPLRATWAATHPPIGERPSLRTPLPPPPEGLAGPPCGPQGRRRGPFSRWWLLSGAVEWATSPSPATTATVARRRSWAPRGRIRLPPGRIYGVRLWGPRRRRRGMRRRRRGRRRCDNQPRKISYFCLNQPILVIKQ